MRGINIIHVRMQAEAIARISGKHSSAELSEALQEGIRSTGQAGIRRRSRSLCRLHVSRA
jgi:hypothetical protein